jgi:hypothetical protein
MTRTVDQMTRKIDQIEQDITRLTDELTRAKNALNEFNQLTLDKKIAILLHDKTCFSNHADMCGWNYEIKNGIHDFNATTHRDYLTRAQLIIKKLRINLMLNDNDNPYNLYDIVKAVIE